MLATRGLGLHIGGARIVEDVTLEARAGRAGRHHRAERRREDVAVQPHLGAGPTDDRPGRAGGGGHHRRVRRRAAAVRGSGGRSRSRASSRGSARSRTSGSQPRQAWEGRSGSGVGPTRSDRRSTVQRGRSRGWGSRDRAAWPAGALAHGDQRKLELAMVLAGKPNVILLDEPMAGVSAEDVDGLTALIGSVHREESKTDPPRRAPHGGRRRSRRAHRRAPPRRLLAFDEPEAVMQNETVQAAYIGEPL